VATTPGAAAFTRTVRGIRAGDPAGMEALCAQFTTGLQLFFATSLGHNRAPGLAQDVLRAASDAIQSGELPDPTRLPGLVRTIARSIRDCALAGSSPSSRPEDESERPRLDPRKAEAATAALKAMPAKGREVLRRFYFQKHPPLRVCSEMNLSLEQFHRLKSQARQEFAAELRGEPAPPAQTLKGRARAAQVASKAAAG